MEYKIIDNNHIATFDERTHARIYYQALIAYVPASQIVVEVYDEGMLVADEIEYVRS